MNAAMFEEIIIENRTCMIRQHGSGGPVLYWPTFLHREDEIMHLWGKLDKVLLQQDFLLVAFLADDWNADFSPWEAPPVFGEEAFAGRGRETLEWLLHRLMPYVDMQYREARNQENYLMGYSMAGLFALWSGYESTVFSGIACCSGSLWYPKWDSYVKQHALQQACDIYLSLGKKEEKTRNQVMSVVGERTREQEKNLQADPKVKHVILEWNEGGHFADSGQRLAKGIKWLMEQRNIQIKR